MSSKTGVLSFDEWAKLQGLPLEKDENGLYVNRHTHYARKGWEAKPEKAEVDELQKRVKELELINFDSELHFDAAKEEIVRLKGGLEALLKSYQAQSGLPMSDEFNRGWVSAFACVHDDLKNLIK